MKVFISYSRDDRAWVYELYNALRNETNHHVWIDQQIITGTDWWTSILTNIEICECFIFVMTPKSIQSVFCEAEWQYALELNKPILPILLKPCNFPQMLERKRIQYLDVSTSNISLQGILLKLEQAFSAIQDSMRNGQYIAQLAERPNCPNIQIEAPADLIHTIHENTEPRLKSVGLQSKSETEAVSIKLLNLVTSPRPKDRIEAIEKLGELGTSHTTIINALCDEDINVRRRAVQILFQFRSDEIYDELIAILRGQRETRFRNNLDVSRINALLVIKNYPVREGYIELLKDLCTDYDPDIRLLSAFAAGDTRSKSLWKSLIELLNDVSLGWSEYVLNTIVVGYSYKISVNIGAALALLKIDWERARKHIETNMDGKFIEQLNQNRYVQTYFYES